MASLELGVDHPFLVHSVASFWVTKFALFQRGKNTFLVNVNQSRVTFKFNYALAMHFHSVPASDGAYFARMSENAGLLPQKLQKPNGDL